MMQNQKQKREELLNDEVVLETRKAREDHARKLGYDPARIIADLRRTQAEGGRKVVSFPARRVDPQDKKAA
jgi:hypothetical protein